MTYPDVEAHEIDPWQEAGETWRRLAVTFPPSNANHNPDQIFYYDVKYMQRRMEYSAASHRSATDCPLHP